VISVIVPTLNAQGRLADCLAALVPAAQDGLVRQVIVADGGSQDATAAIAEGFGADWSEAPRGRGAQMGAGAAAARAEWLLFLHADTVLEPAWAEAARRHMAASPGCAAAFRLAFDDDAPAARRVARWANRRARWLALPYGDQGLLMPRALYQALGGFRPLPLMEDADLVRRIGRARLRLLDAAAVTSAAKYRAEGWARRVARNALAISLLLAGVSPERIARLYR
jgi:rSAM/selenodomain-associated transferase 2